jgi:hypothetical protein
LALTALLLLVVWLLGVVGVYHIGTLVQATAPTPDQR